MAKNGKPGRPGPRRDPPGVTRSDTGLAVLRVRCDHHTGGVQCEAVVFAVFPPGIVTEGDVEVFLGQIDEDGWRQAVNVETGQIAFWFCPQHASPFPPEKT